MLGSSSVTIPAGGNATVNVTLNVPVATVGASNGAALSFREVAGLITLTPTGGSNNGVTLRVPYYLVPRALSGVNATMAKSVTTRSPSTNANLSNPSGPIAGDADFYAWGLNDRRTGYEPGGHSGHRRPVVLTCATGLTASAARFCR